MSEDLFAQLYPTRAVPSELILPRSSRFSKTRQKKAINSLLDECQKQEIYASSSVLQEYQKKKQEQRNKKAIQRSVGNRNISQTFYRDRYPKMNKNYSMRIEPRKNFSLVSPTSTPKMQDEQQNLQEQQTKIGKLQEQKKYIKELIPLSQTEFKLPNPMPKFQQPYLEEISTTSFDIRCSKNLKIRQLLAKIKKQKDNQNKTQKVNPENELISNYQLPICYESIQNKKKRKLSKEFKLNSNAFDNTVYAIPKFNSPVKQKQVKQFKVKPLSEFPSAKTSIKVKNKDGDQGTIKGVKLT